MSIDHLSHMIKAKLLMWFAIYENVWTYLEMITYYYIEWRVILIEKLDNVYTSDYKHFNGYRTLCSCPGGVTVTNCSVLYCSKAVRMPSWKTTGFVHKPTIKNWLMWSKYFNPSSLPTRLGSKTFVYIPLNTSLTSPGGQSSKNFPISFRRSGKPLCKIKREVSWPLSARLWNWGMVGCPEKKLETALGNEVVVGVVY